MKYPAVFTVVFALLIFFSPQVKSQVKVVEKGNVNQEADNRANNTSSEYMANNLRMEFVKI